MTYRVNLLDPCVMCDDQVYQLRDEVLRRRLTNKQPHMVESVGGPGEENQETYQNGTDWVNVPSDPAADNGHGETECVDNDVIAMINEEDMDCGVSAVNVAKDAERTLAKDCRCPVRPRLSDVKSRSYLLANDTNAMGIMWSSSESFAPPPSARPDSIWKFIRPCAAFMRAHSRSIELQPSS